MKDFRLQAYSKVVAISLASILQIMLGALVANNVTNLLLSLIVGWIAASLVVTSNYRKEIRFFRSNTLKLKAYAAANVFRNFPLHIAPGNILDVLSISLAPLLLSLSFKAEELGYYSLAMMIITAPIALFGKALSQVFYQRLSAASKVGHLYDEFNRISKPILFWGCIFSLFLALAAPLITEIIFGEPWIETGYYIRILCPILLLQFQANALSPILLVAGETSKLFKVQLYLAIATISSLCIGPLYMPNAHSTLLLYSLFSSVAYLYYLRSIKTSAAKLQK